VIRLALRVRRDDAGIALAELLELAPDGVEEVPVDEHVVEYAVYGAAGELPSLPDLRAAAGSALVDVSTTEVPDDWSERWRDFHRPVLVEPPPGSAVGALHVRPPWDAPSERPHAREIVIDPGQAFGTGAHATTRMCLAQLLELSALGLAGGPLLDVGCGSGVLAIAAAGLGWAPVLGLDHEQESVAATRDNARTNGVRLEARHFDLRREPLPAPGAGGDAVGGETVVANLLRPLLLILARSMTAAPGQLLLSGLLADEVDEVSGAFSARLHMVERGRREMGEWAAVWLSGVTPAR
jgi:ribosomal protein L11 methyltransferase